MMPVMKNLVSKCCGVFLLACLYASPLHAAGVTVVSSGTTVSISNDYLERTLSTAGGILHTAALRNKLSGRTYSLAGAEFQLNIAWERLGYYPGSENPLALTTDDFQVKSHRVVELPDGGKRLEFELDLDRTAKFAPLPILTWTDTSLHATVLYELHPNSPYMRQWLVLKTTGKLFLDSVAVARNSWPGASFVLGGFGQPLYANDLFLGLEYPTSYNIASGPSVSLSSIVGMLIPPDGYTSEPVVIGVTAAGMAHSGFMSYVEHMRITQPRYFVQYNSWYDVQGLTMTSAKMIARAHELTRLTAQYGIKLDSFTLDEDWDDPNHLWAIDPKRFPDGFGPLVRSLDGMHARLGLWFSPAGGWGAGNGPWMPRSQRIATARKEGMEITLNGQFLCTAGKRYSSLLRNTLLNMQRTYATNYFKFDGEAFGCNNISHGHPIGVYSRELQVRDMINDLQALRTADPGVFLNLTSSFWLSPWWLRYADSVWMGGTDYGYMNTLPSIQPRQSAISYRNSMLYDDLIRHRVQFPPSALMTHGIIKADFNMLGGEHEPLQDWVDGLVNYFSIGNALTELYLTPSKLTSDEWKTLAETIHWAKHNKSVLLGNSTMVLGDPAKRQAHGFVHDSPNRIIATVRNPFVQPLDVPMRLDLSNGIAAYKGLYRAELIYPYREQFPGTYFYGATVKLHLGAYEQQVVVFRPASTPDLVEGTRYSINPTPGNGSLVRLYATAGSTADVVVLGHHIRVRFPGQSALPATTSDAKVLFSGTNPRHITVHLRTSTPDSWKSGSFALLVEPVREIAGAQAHCSSGARDLHVSVQNGGRGDWYWYTMPVAAGTTDIKCGLDFPTGAETAGTRVSGWLLGDEELAAHDIRIKSVPARFREAFSSPSLPTSSNLLRVTVPAFEDILH